MVIADVSETLGGHICAIYIENTPFSIKQIGFLRYLVLKVENEGEKPDEYVIPPHSPSPMAVRLMYSSIEHERTYMG